MELLNIKMKKSLSTSRACCPVHHLAGLCSVRRWSSPAGRPSPPLHLTFWTNWWGAHLATMLASDRTSKVTSMRWEDLLLSGQVWGRALLILHNNLRSELAQITRRWVRRERCCRLRYFPTRSLVCFFSSFRVMCSYCFMLTHSLKL